MRECDLTPQEKYARQRVLEAKGRALQDSYQSQRLLTEQLQRAKEGHAAWVRHQNEMREPGYRDKIMAKMAEEYAAKQAKEAEEDAIRAQLESFEAKIRAK